MNQSSSSWQACLEFGRAAGVIASPLFPHLSESQRGQLMKSGMIECSVCHSKLVSPNTKAVSRAYDRHRNKISSKQRALNVLLVVGDCFLVGLQPILVFMSKEDGKFKFSPISVNFLTEVAKVLFAIVMLLFQARRQKVGEKPLLSVSTFVQAARSNVLLAVPAFLYAINNYLKFTMQLYFNPATVKMLSNLKVLVIAVLLKIIMKRRFSIIQWEALALLLIGISINQLRSLPEGTTALGLPVATGAYAYTLIFVTVPSMASVFNEYALKSQYDTSIYLQNLFLYGYGAIFNFLAILGTTIVTGPKSFDILEGHSKATMLLILNNAAQGILSSFFFKYADTILKKYSSTVATIFTGIASAALFGHTLTINFLLGISVVFISMHQFFSPLSKVKDEEQTGVLELMDAQNNHKYLLNLFVCQRIHLSSTWQQEQMRRLHIMQGLMKDSHFFPSEVIKGFVWTNSLLDLLEDFWRYACNENHSKK
ncbi:hypothetical protein RHGRI_004038 [Rhododendron griersonianum]|uniref:CMP-sialic acid transporter 3 n=2 Tax=Magnoliopsida TaxID=3398 RepID=A0AAV6L732_9ERIC|nr:hypothetical protein RHGRI_004038 [Rhododendron griersonianum]